MDYVKAIDHNLSICKSQPSFSSCLSGSLHGELEHRFAKCVTKIQGKCVHIMPLRRLSMVSP